MKNYLVLWDPTVTIHKCRALIYRIVHSSSTHWSHLTKTNPSKESIPLYLKHCSCASDMIMEFHLPILTGSLLQAAMDIQPCKELQSDSPSSTKVLEVARIEQNVSDLPELSPGSV